MLKVGDQVYETSNPSHHGTVTKVLEFGEVCEVEWSFFTDLHYTKDLKLVDQNTPKSYKPMFVVPFPTTPRFVVAADKSFIDFLGEFKHKEDIERKKRIYQDMLNELSDPYVIGKRYPIIFIVDAEGDFRIEYNKIHHPKEEVDIETAKQIIEMNWDRKELKEGKHGTCAYISESAS